MNKYPLWKNILIAVLVALGALYAVPNFYGEVPAIQISPTRATKVDAALVARVEGILKQANVAYTGTLLEEKSAKIRFSDTETQLRARDVVGKDLGDDYVVALNLLPAAPAWMQALGGKPMSLGLDLRGGVHFLMQVDTRAVVKKAEDAAADDMRRLLRENKIRDWRVARLEGGSIEARFKDAPQRDSAVDVFKKDLRELDYVPSERGGEFFVQAQLSNTVLVEKKRQALEQNITTLNNRVNELGVAEPVIQQQGLDRIVVQLPGVQDTARAKEIIGRTATLEVRLVDEDARRGGGQASVDVFPERQRNGAVVDVLVKRQVVVTGDRFVNAQATFDERQRPAVAVELDARGGRIMRDTTRDNLHRHMAIILFEKGKGEAISVAEIQGEISNRFQISGSFTPDETINLGLLIRAGSLAAPMEIIEERTVGPSLGADNIQRGFHSTWVGFAAIAVFMIIYYLMFGITAVIALAVNVLLLVGLLSLPLWHATLTLPGMAGIALTIGMAIDANVLINERIREELRNGNTPQASIKAGYERAFATILDSNFTTLFAGVALLLVPGSVRGFAVVLCFGIVTSMFSGVMVSRALVNLIYGSRPKLAGLAIGNTRWHQPDDKSGDRK